MDTITLILLMLTMLPSLTSDQLQADSVFQSKHLLLHCP